MAEKPVVTDAAPGPQRVSAGLRRLRERLHWLWHAWRGPSDRKLAEARAALSGRAYYELYDDVYRDLRASGGSPDRRAEQQRIWALMYHDFEELRGRGRLPGPPASLIDLGCGEGDNAVQLAALGYRVTGIDISPTAIDIARVQAARREQDVEFRAGSVLDLAGIPEGVFDLAIDVGCLHMLVRSDDRARYLRSTFRVLRPAGKFFLFNRVFERDVEVADEEKAIWKSVTFVRSRFRTRGGEPLPERGCGFRGASLGQYRKELELAGFEVTELFAGTGEHSRFATIVASRTSRPTAPHV